MRIERIEIGAFGPLRGMSVNTEGPITLIYGPNEAGKSSVLEFIRALLFGFHSKGGAGRYVPDPSVIQGGRLILNTGGGDRITVERWDRSPEGKGRTPAAGLVKVIFPDGAVGGERELSELVGGMTPDVFQHVFAFGLTELQELGTLQQDEVSGFLYSAGLGISGAVIRTAQRKLTQEMEQLYRPRGRTPLVNQALQRLAEAEEQLGASRRQSEKYETLLHEEGALSERCKRMEEELAELQRKTGELERLRQAKPHALRYELVYSELRELPAALDHVPEDALAREEALEAERERIALEQDRVSLQLEETDAELAVLQAEADRRRQLLVRRQETEALVDRLAAYEETLRQQGEAAGEAERQQAELERLLRRIGPDWSLSTLEQLRPAVLLREEAAFFREEWRGWKQELAVLDGERKRIEQELAEGAAEETEAGGGRQTAAALERVGAARRLLADWREAQRELRHAGQRLRDLERIGAGTPEAGTSGSEGGGRAFLPGLIAAALILPALLLALGEPVAAAVAFVLMAAGIGGAVRSRLRRQAGKGQPGRGGRAQRAGGAAGAAERGAGLGPLEAHAAELAVRLSAELGALGWPGLAAGAAETAAARGPAAGEAPADGLRPRGAGAAGRRSAAAAAADGAPAPGASAGPAADAGALPLPPEDIEPWLDALERQLRASAARQAARAGAEQRLAALEAQAAAHARAGEPLAARWREWLRASALPEAASPDAALELLALAEAALGELQRLRRLEARRAAWAGEAAAFAAAAAELLGPEAASGPAAALRARQAELSRAVDREREAAQRRERQAELRRQSALLGQQRERVDARSAELYRAAGAADGESLRRLYRQAQRRRELSAAGRQETAALRALLGESWEQSLLQLREDGGRELEHMQAEIDARLEEISRGLEEAREARSRLRMELERLADGSRHANAMQLVEECRTETLRLAGRWAVQALCQQLIVRTKTIFEQDKQPLVMRRASEDFSRITGGRYTRILTPIGEQRVLAELSEGGLVETGRLSRGTAEQMYVCIRLALADEYGATGIRLPLIMDDLFVNFDDERLRRGLELLETVAGRGQLLLFTCHRHVQQAYAARFPASTIVRLPALERRMEG
ncbi:AAA family ATPase [Paenibacillus puerhi]|uniref:AAA family ATPase n=1 Tax=Paenibacillus puerhi TaxID=2692622 RepID=UPI00135C64B4|nr:AAA family ATPase [Paenibacillus puerhi]